MSKSNNLTDFLTDVAQAIRYKKDLPVTSKLNPQSFASQIISINAMGFYPKVAADAILINGDTIYRNYSGDYRLFYYNSNSLNTARLTVIGDNNHQDIELTAGALCYVITPSPVPANGAIVVKLLNLHDPLEISVYPILPNEVWFDDDEICVTIDGGNTSETVLMWNLQGE